MKRWMVTAFALFATAAAASPTATAQRSGTDVVERTREPVDAILDGWLEAFNSGDRERIKSFYARYADDPEPAFALEQAEDTCGVSLYREVARSPTALTVLMGQQCAAGLQRLKLELAAPGASKLKSLDLRPLPIPGNGGVDVTAQIAERLAARDEFAGSLLG